MDRIQTWLSGFVEVGNVGGVARPDSRTKNVGFVKV